MNKSSPCPICGNDKYKSKEAMLKEILKTIDYKGREPWAYGGNISTFEMKAIYEWVRGRGNKGEE